MADFDVAVKTMVRARTENAVAYGLPLLNLAMDNSDSKAMGKSFKWRLQKATLEGHAASAGPYTPIEGHRTDIWGWATLPWKYVRATDLMTMQEHDFSQGQEWTGSFVTEKANALLEGLRIRTSRMLWGLDGISTDGGLDINSLRQALTHDATYAGLGRATTVTNPWFQSASLDRTYTDQGTEVRISLDLFDQIGAACRRNIAKKGMSKGKQKLYHFCGEALYLACKRELRSYITAGEGYIQRLNIGFESFEFENNEVVLCDELYDDNYKGSETTYPARWLFSIDPSTLVFSFNPLHKLGFGSRGKALYKSQNDHIGGTATFLAVVDTFCNFAVSNPNRCCFRSNVVA